MSGVHGSWASDGSGAIGGALLQARLQREDETKRFVDSLHLGGGEASGRVAQPLGINHGRLFDEDARLGSKLGYVVGAGSLTGIDCR